MNETAGDFERVFNDCYEPLFRYVARRVAADAVQDVVSETFLVAWRRHSDLRGEPLPWLLGIARRVASTQRRGSARREALRERLHAERAPVEATAGIEASDPRLGQALACLPERDREALILIAWDGLDHRTAARGDGLQHRLADGAPAPRPAPPRTGARRGRPGAAEPRRADGIVAVSGAARAEVLARLAAADPARALPIDRRLGRSCGSGSARARAARRRC